ncbi:MAG: hypothetical protein MI924_36565 [Chloroflexales bacterium]|nr:hypothetical protein [Chloroflexales bacterium]
MTKYARPRLISADDKRYRAYVAQFVLQRQNQRAMRPPRQRDIFGGQAEDALRAWLGERYSLSERRILEYEERRGKWANTKYRELDALALEERTAWVFEIKASRVAGSVRRAVAQLQETRAILSLIFDQVQGTILLVDTGIPTIETNAELMAGPEPPPTPPETLAEALEKLPEVQLITNLDERSHGGLSIDLLRFSVDNIIALVGAENLALDWEADDEAEESPQPAAERGPLYSTSDDASDNDDGDNPLAAALRRAGLKG